MSSWTTLNKFIENAFKIEILTYVTCRVLTFKVAKCIQRANPEKQMECKSRSCRAHFAEDKMDVDSTLIIIIYCNCTARA